MGAPQVLEKKRKTPKKKNSAKCINMQNFEFSLDDSCKAFRMLIMQRRWHTGIFRRKYFPQHVR